MISIEQIAKPASTQKIGLFATLRGPLHVKGSGARETGKGGGTASAPRRPALASLLTLLTTLGALAFTATPALAAALEKPEAGTPTEVKAETATLQGVLSPKSPGELGSTYEFVYRPSPTACKGAGEVKGTEGMSLGGEAESVSEPITALKPDTEYTVCVVVHNAAKTEEALSAPLTFTTAPEAPETISPAKLITTTTATFEGVLNPKAAAAVKAGWYFAYNLGASCAGGSTTHLEAEATVKAASESKGVTELQPHALYTFCLVATNAAGEAVAGNEVALETEAAKPEVTGETTALPVKATEASLEAQVNPNNQSTTYRFEYSTSATGETLNAPVTTLASATVLGGFGNQTASVATGPALSQNTTYYYRAVATNSTGTTPGTVKHFKTAIAPETPEKLEAEPIGPTTATLKGVLDPNKAGEAGTYEFAYRQSAGECQRENPTTHLRENEKATTPESSATTSPQPVSAAVTELLPGAQYTFCLIAHNSAGETTISSPVTFTTLPAAPAIASESVSNVEPTEATLNAQIDPDGAATSYYFEYGGSEAYGQSTPEIALAGLTGTETVAAGIKGLQPGTIYHYRVFANNSLSPAGGTPGPDKTFTTPITLGSEPSQNCQNEQFRAEQPYGLKLPDCRAYEMVSPLNSKGQDATDSFDFSDPRASVSGEAVTYASFGNFADPTGSAFEDQFLSRRGPTGWSTQEITPLHHAVSAANVTSYEAVAFTPELTEGIAASNAALVPGGPESEGNNEEVGLYVDDFANDSYRYASGGEGLQPNNPLGASADLSHVVLSGESEWVNGKIVLFSVTNKGENKGGYAAISPNGSRVYFGNGPSLYFRENAEQPQSPMSGEECTVPADACTIEVSASQRRVVDPHGPQAATYQGVSSDGSRVFFTSSAELTEDAYTGPADNADNLYEYDSGKAQSERLKDLTVDDTDADGAAVHGVVGLSEDGSYVYFVADGALAARATVGEPNLYVSHDGGDPTFIATLSANDASDWDLYGPLHFSAVVNSDGSYLAFMSERSLTGYDNEQAESGECENGFELAPLVGSIETGKCREIYIYDAETNNLTCASCNPSGARPVGIPTLPRPNNVSSSLYRPRDLADDGALFFDSTDELVPHASDGRENVYEYENGHVYPISDVAGGQESFFMDASANGDNVFFATADQLLPEDTSNNVVVYDARVDGGFPVSVSPPSCDNGDSCKPPPAPQPGVFGAPGSATFSGPGNVTAPPPPAVVKPKAKVVKCKKGFVKNKKDKCVKAKTKKRKAKQSNRRAK